MTLIIAGGVLGLLAGFIQMIWSTKDQSSKSDDNDGGHNNADNNSRTDTDKEADKSKPNTTSISATDNDAAEAKSNTHSVSTGTDASRDASRVGTTMTKRERLKRMNTSVNKSMMNRFKRLLKAVKVSHTGAGMRSACVQYHLTSKCDESLSAYCISSIRALRGISELM